MVNAQWHWIPPVIKRSIRTEHLSQKIMAEQLGISQKHLSQVLGCRADPSLELLERMLDYVGLELVVRRRR